MTGQGQKVRTRILFPVEQLTVARYTCQYLWPEDREEWRGSASETNTTWTPMSQ